LRFAAQGLSGDDTADSSAIVRRLLAVQAQDARSFPLALRARSTGLTYADVAAALDTGTLVVSWLMRGTLHLVHRDDYPWLWALTSPRAATSNQRRLGEEGVPPAEAQHALTVIERVLADGPRDRAELAQHLAAAGVRTQGQAMPHLLMLAALRGLIVQGARGRFVLVDPPPEPLSGDARERALRELARRYLRGHGPATEADLTTWSGLGLRDVRAGLRRLGGAIQENGALVDLTRREAAPRRLPARLLPAFDPYLLGWRDRDFAVAAAHRRQVFPGGGMLRAVATVDGLAVATWTLRHGPRGPVVTLAPFAPVDEATLASEIDDVIRFESGVTAEAVASADSTRIRPNRRTRSGQAC
jgi:hypothetical protein